MRKLKKYSILSLILLLFLAYFLFLKLISTSDVKISINKETAIEYAIILADELNINYNGCKIMASFDMNQDEKAYLEFNKLKVDEISKTDIYSPYKWIIKFINNNGNKSEIYLTPQGDPYGFVNEMLNKENYNNTNTNILEKKIIEYAKNNLNTNLSNYIIIDSNKLFLNNGCVQYNYTYENKNLEGIPLRVNISVVGDQITSLFKYINIPSVFKNKYNNLKIFSNIIYQIGNLSMYLFYFFICCLLGIIYLIKNHFIIIRKSIFLGTIMASFELISQLNQLPANELSPKSVSYSSLILSIIMQFVINVIIFTIVVIVAEGLTRKAFPKHIQLWSILNREVLQSKQIFNQVIIGYILVIFKLLYTIILFNITTSYFDWWSPSGDSSFIVNTTYLPWLTPVLSAIRAGIMEELLCRAIPIASIILISKKMKFKNSIIFIVVLFQAIIFGLLHTFYPVYPWYARIIELFIPSIIYAIIYIRVGLLPIILAHIIYNVIINSTALFSQTTVNSTFDRFIAVIFIILPISVILILYQKKCKFIVLNSKFINESWIAKVKAKNDVIIPKINTDSIKDILLSTFKYLKPYKIRFAFSFICIIIYTILQNIQPLLFGDIIDNITLHNYDILPRIMIIIIGIFLIGIIINFIQSYLMIKIACSIELTICKQIFDGILNLPLYEFWKSKKGEFIEKLEQDVRAFSNILTSKVLIIIDVASAFIIAFILFKINWILSVILISMFPISLVIFFFFGKIISKKEKILKNGKDYYLSFLQETLQGFKAIKIFNIENMIGGKYQQHIQRLYKIGVDKVVINTTANTLSYFINFVSYIIIIIISAYLIFINKLTLGEMVAFNTYSSMFTGSLYKISRLNTEVQEAIISLKRVFDLLIFYPTMDKDINNHVKDNIFDGIIIFDNVSFTYNEREEVYTLQNLSLKIQPNNITAIIGESGSGKTTIFNLLFGLFDNYTGNIYIDGVELRSIPRTILCENISYVTQDFFMITGTVKENLSLANTNAIDEDIYEACKESFIHDFIMTLPNGYNTKLGEGGIDLSQGQKQRLSIARSLLRKPHMFLFDEITSSLDNDTELIINNLIKKLSYNHTVILISHRDTCIADAHKVINIKEGRNVNMCNRLEKF